MQARVKYKQEQQERDRVEAERLENQVTYIHQGAQQPDLHQIHLSAELTGVEQRRIIEVQQESHVLNVPIQEPPSLLSPETRVQLSPVQVAGRLLCGMNQPHQQKKKAR
jgi:hypothetical protein